MSFGSKIKEYRLIHNMSQEDLAKKLNTTKQVISRYENDQRSPKISIAADYAKQLGVSLDTLVDDKIDNIIPINKVKKIPLLGTIACGEPILADENIEEYILLPDKLTADFALRCKGDSMINARIKDGDIVYIHQQPTVDNGEIAAVLIDDEATLKRVFIYKDKIILQAENPKYEPFVYVKNEMKNVTILGKAVGFTSLI